MPENPHDERDLEKEREKLLEEKKKSAPGDPEKPRSYYYDDACGYEVYQDTGEAAEDED